MRLMPGAALRRGAGAAVFERPAVRPAERLDPVVLRDADFAFVVLLRTIVPSWLRSPTRSRLPGAGSRARTGCTFRAPRYWRALTACASTARTIVCRARRVFAAEVPSRLTGARH